MPSRQIVGGEPYRYGYQGEFAETDSETGKPAFQLRLWDTRLGRWLTTDPKKEFKSPYIGMGNMPIVAVDPDGGDIIILMDREAVGGLGHSAVLIGNDVDGWKYFSKNGTEKGYWFAPESGRAYGDNYKPDRGTLYKGKTVSDVIRQVNENSNAKHNYDVYIRVVTTDEQDEKAILAAYNEADTTKYSIFGSFCIEVPQEALKATEIDFKYKGYNNLTPNDWFINFGWYNNNHSYNLVTPPKPKVTFEFGEGTFEYDNKKD